MPKLIYLATPYSDPDPEIMKSRYITACKSASDIMRAGHFVYSPIAHCHGMSQFGNLPGEFGFWEEYDKHFIDLSDEVWVLAIPGWRTSKGVEHEMNHAFKTDKPVLILTPSNIASIPENFFAS